MTTIPPSVASSTLTTELQQAGLTQSSIGKVRHTFTLNDSVLLQFATNRISIFDFVLPALVIDKGAILTALTVYWLTNHLSKFSHHLVAFGRGIDRYLPESLRNTPALQAQAIVVTKCKVAPVEAIVRAYLTGSGKRTYDESGQVCGIQLPEGLHDGSRLDEPIFTPTTKAEEGHDEDLDSADVSRQYPWMKELVLRTFQAASQYAASKGVIIADTKCEFAPDGTLVDETYTPDSSRFWDEKEWKEAQKERKAPQAYDKEFARQWGLTVPTPFGITGLKKLSPKNRDHVNFVSRLSVPHDILTGTTDRYHQIFERLTGMSLTEFQMDGMGIKAQG